MISSVEKIKQLNKKKVRKALLLFGLFHAVVNSFNNRLWNKHIAYDVQPFHLFLVSQ